MTRFIPVWLLCLATPLALWGDDYEDAPIRYSQTRPQEQIARLQDLIEQGKSPLKGETGPELLRSMLDYLDVPVESQVLVYSKTSAQNSRISPVTPRAIYFSDDCYVGWVQGGAIEVITFDPNLGAVLWLIEPNHQAAGGHPDIQRPSSCLNCHAGGATRNVPGVLVRSVFPGADGLPEFRAGSHHVGHETPIEQRWGGWYVTGSSGGQTHMGNSIARETREREIVLEPVVETPTALETLEGVIDCSPYPGGATSDIVALMVLEHQKNVHNALVKANLDTQRALHWQRSMFPGETDKLSGTSELVINSQADKVVKQLLFCDEFVMEDEGVEGNAAFQRAFAKAALTASDGRSLRDFRLYERLFKFRCSYVIYSQVFDDLPEVTKAAVYRRLHEVLTAPVAPEGFEQLSDSEREKIVSILRETKKGLPDYWHEREDADG